MRKRAHLAYQLEQEPVMAAATRLHFKSVDTEKYNGERKRGQAISNFPFQISSLVY